MDNPDDPGLDYTFPSDTSLTLGAGKYLLLVKDLTAFTSIFGAPSGPDLQTTLVWSEVDGGSGFCSSSFYVLERIDETEYGNDVINWQADSPTPGQDNDT